MEYIIDWFRYLYSNKIPQIYTEEEWLNIHPYLAT